MILVTGGTGLVGSHLLYELVNKYDRVRAIYRSDSARKHVKHIFSYYSEDTEHLYSRIDWFKADLNDIPELSEAFEGVSQVYHCAALVSFDPSDYHCLRQTNIEGTANIVNLCISHGIEKLCYVSSVATIGNSTNPNIAMTEEAPWNTEDNNNVYAITKYGAEMEVWRGSQEGLDVVIVNPGIILGPGFWDKGSSAIVSKVHKGLPFYTTGITGYIDVWDTVKIMQQLMDSSIKNERFILVSHNLSFKDLIYTIASQLDVKPPRKKASKLLLQLAWRVDWLWQKISRSHRNFTKHMANSAQRQALYDNSKISEILNYNFTDIHESISKICQLYLKDIAKQH